MAIWLKWRTTCIFRIQYSRWIWPFLHFENVFTIWDTIRTNWNVTIILSVLYRRNCGAHGLPVVHLSTARETSHSLWKRINYDWVRRKFNSLLSWGHSLVVAPAILSRFQTCNLVHKKYLAPPNGKSWLAVVFGLFLDRAWSNSASNTLRWHWQSVKHWIRECAPKLMICNSKLAIFR